MKMNSVDLSNSLKPKPVSFFKVCVLSCSVMSDLLRPHRLYVAFRAPLSMEFSRQEYRSGLPFPTPLFYLKCQ